MAVSWKHSDSTSDQANVNRTIRLQEHEFRELSRILGTLTGIHMNAHKTTLVESRLFKRLRTLGLVSFEDYVDRLKKDPKERTAFINALTTNKTEFFREPYHFDFLVHSIVKEKLQKSAAGTLHVWCAAASTGEEPYTLAMVLAEAFKDHPRWNFRILASDIDTDVLQIAESGVYKRDAVQSMRPDYLQRYFLRGLGDNQGFYKVQDDIQTHIKFRQFNLVADELPSDIRFDVIFLRNVLIYFQTDTIQQVVDKLSKRIMPGGYLIVGHSETLNRVNHQLEPMHAAIYRKKL